MVQRILPLLCCTALAFGNPTESREWTSSAGTKVTGSATEFKNGKITLKTTTGRTLTLGLEKFSSSDTEFLKSHFGIISPSDFSPSGSRLPFIDGDLAHPQGEITGPVKIDGGSSYYVYLPKSLRKGREAPLIFYTNAGGGNKGLFKYFIEAAEISGWIISTSVESRNGGGWEKNHEHAKRCVEDLLDTLPIDEDRVYFTGNSGGGAMSFYNALRIKSLGNLPIVAYSKDRKYPKGQYCIGVGGATDYNRYLTAIATKSYKKRGFHRFVPGGHTGGPPWVQNECLLWLNGRYLGDQRKNTALDAERLDFERSMITWLNTLKAKAPHRAHYWCHFLTTEYGIVGANAGTISTLLKDLSKNGKNVHYTQGLYALDEFSKKYYAPLGEGGGSKRKHTTPKIKRAAQKLFETYEGVPEIETIAQQLGNETA